MELKFMSEPPLDARLLTCPYRIDLTYTSPTAGLGRSAILELTGCRIIASHYFSLQSSPALSLAAHRRRTVLRS